MLTMILSVAFAGEPAPPPIVNGSETSDFEQVGVLFANYENYGGAPFCSGTLIHEKWVVTAAHCVEAVDDYASAGYEIYFILGTNLHDQENGWADYDLAVSWVEHPDYSGVQSTILADIGLMELETGITAVEPVPLNDVTPGIDWQGLVLDYVGWGVTYDEGGDSGIKRTTQIPYIEADEQFIYSYDPDTNLCSGDSGGAALLEREDGFYLVGVNSFVFSVQGSDPCVGGGSGATRIDAYLDWIYTYVPEPVEEEPDTAEEDTGEEEECGKSELFCGCSTVTPDISLWFFLLGLGLVVKRRAD